MEVPDFTGLEHKGLKVDADVGLHGILKVIANVAKIVGIDIEKKMEAAIEDKIRSEVKDRVEKIEKQDIQTGRWMEKYLSTSVFRGKLVDQLEVGLNREINRRGPSSNFDMSATIEAGCEALAKNYGSYLGGNFELICRKSFELKAQLLVEAKGNRAKGCYRHYFAASDWRANQGEEPWWAEECKIRNHISVTVPQELTPLYACMQDILKTNPKQIFETGTCAGELDYIESHLSAELKSLLKKRAKLKQKLNPYTKEFLDLIRDRFEDLASST